MALYSFGELSAMSVKGLRALVRKHNLHVALKGYSKMRKTPLIHAFLAKKPAKPTAATAGPSPKPPPAPKKKQAVARVASRTTAVEPSAPKKKTGGVSDYCCAEHPKTATKICAEQKVLSNYLNTMYNNNE